ncbi:hypothetical protein [Hymenobacter endophyticus]|uniref:Uncharacterized protein n=1 Tax=Hymenobacter endophyticus TaxID=3076335 RepID=A0ABU3TMT3_9BACT|nr:hypothetical protein [Hymenobacter endophyticus]MDU0372684.1 hypothetical protein [Hymenobacter endophyticus]
MLGLNNVFGQIGELMYDSVPKYNIDTVSVFYDYNKHMFFSYDVSTKYTALKYGFIHRYEGRVPWLGYRAVHLDRLNRRWSKQMQERNGINWTTAYYKDLKACRDTAVFQEFVHELPDTTFNRIKNFICKEQLLKISPLHFLSYLSTTAVHYGSPGELLEMRRNVKFLVEKKDNWVKKSDVAVLMRYIYANENHGGSIAIRRACLCPDTVLRGQPTTVGLEAYKLIALFRGYDYPTSFTNISRAEVD